ncbi:MAG: phage tail tape measure protein [Planctomyces sp.]|nr:phage tail tape measure protein [Planctomyces sp.]
MSRGKAIEAGGAYVRLFAEDSELRRGLKQAAQHVRAWGAALQKTGAIVAGLGTAVATPLIAAVKAFESAGSALAAAADRTGITVERLSRLSFAAAQSSTNLETLEGGLRQVAKLVAEAGEGSKAAAAKLQKLGISLQEIQAMTPDEQFRRIAQAISEIENPTLRAAAALDTFGKSGTQLLPLMSGGAAGIKALEEEAERLGLTMSTKDANAARALGDALNRVRMLASHLAVMIGGVLAPYAARFVAQATALVKTFTAWASENREVFVSVAQVAAITVALGFALGALGTAIQAVGYTIEATSFIVGALGQIWGALGSIVGFVTGTFRVAQAGALLLVGGLQGLGAAAVATGPMLRGLGTAIVDAAALSRTALATVVAQFGTLKVAVGLAWGTISNHPIQSLVSALSNLSRVTGLTAAAKATLRAATLALGAAQTAIMKPTVVLKAGLAALRVGALATSTAFVATGTAIKAALIPALAGLGTVLGVVFSPLGIAVGILAAIVHYSGLGKKALQWLSDGFRWLGDTVRNALGDVGMRIYDSIVGGIQKAWNAALDWLIGAWKKVQSWLGLNMDDQLKEMQRIAEETGEVMQFDGGPLQPVAFDMAELGGDFAMPDFELPESGKKIKKPRDPADWGGLAGGLKFLNKNIDDMAGLLRFQRLAGKAGLEGGHWAQAGGAGLLASGGTGLLGALAGKLSEAFDIPQRLGMREDKIGAAGTFSAAAVRGMGVGAYDEQIAANSKETAKNTKKIADRGNGVPRFR